VKNYTDSDYALNKFSAGIVYSFADGSKFTYTLADYLAENPGKTEEDFRALKKISDGIYLDQVTDENAQTKKNVPLDELSGSMKYAPSPEDLHIGGIEAREESERHVRRTELSRRALALLTDTQRRRYLLHRVDGKTTREIAAAEGLAQRTVMDSLELAQKKINNFLTQTQKRPLKTGF
jgi:DNA-directed RNA polymerase specialized sigma24 family protein